MTKQELKTLDEILELYDLMGQSENNQKFILNQITSWFSSDPRLQLEVKEEPLLTEQAKAKLAQIKTMLDWNKLDPLFYTSVYESMMESTTRRQLGAHYTSRENIHKVIDPLFLDDLKKRVDEVVKNKDLEQAKALHEELSKLTFLDPACGSGNFLVETYMCLRQLENKLIKLILSGQNKHDYKRAMGS